MRYPPVMKTILALLVVAATAAYAEPIRAFDAPEQAHWHEGSRSWYVSNLGGGVSLEKDGVGWITKLDEDGNVAVPQWVAGLHAPTGMDSAGDLLYVVDRDALVVIDVPTATIARRVPLPGVEFPNDVVVGSGGEAYVSDFMGHRIVMVDGDIVETFYEGEGLRYPNGLAIDGASLVVATWGDMTNSATFEVGRPGTVFLIDLSVRDLMPLGEGAPMGSFDGIVKIDERFYGTDWLGGRLLRIERDGSFRPVLSGFRMLADLGYRPETRQIMMPEMSADRVILLSLDP